LAKGIVNPLKFTLKLATIILGVSGKPIKFWSETRYIPILPFSRSQYGEVCLISEGISTDKESEFALFCFKTITESIFAFNGEISTDSNEIATSLLFTASIFRVFFEFAVVEALLATASKYNPAQAAIISLISSDFNCFQCSSFSC